MVRGGFESRHELYSPDVVATLDCAQMPLPLKNTLALFSVCMHL